ncbi:MAG: TM1812 family CRISPR-associated protein, partial [Myxococcales bacterium]|nr:TM1812 family CRISPR-associated protein [Myxococcales bacterium]
MTRTLICSFGAPRSGYREMTYTEGSATCTSRFVPVAIAQLVGDVERVLIVVTPTVLRRRAEPGLLDDMIAELAPRTTSELSVPEPDAPDSAAETVGVLLDALAALPRETELVLDLSLAFRSLPFLFFAAVACARELYDHRITRVLYGAAEAEGDAKPLVDVAPALELHDWFFALRALRNDADLAPLERIVRTTNVRARTPDGQLKATVLADDLRKLAGPMQEVLPVEEAIAARTASARAVTMDGIAATHVVATRLLPEVREVFALAAPPSAAGEGAFDRKDGTVLTRAWLEHQLGRIEFHSSHGRVGAALRALGEWLVSRVVLARGEGAEWLAGDVRKRAHAAIVAAGIRGLRPGPLAAEIANLRNPLSHAGLRPQNVYVPPCEHVRDLVNRCADLLPAQLDEALALRAHGDGTLLVSGFGLSPGVLYSALMAVRPSHVLLICSRESRQSLDAVLSR